MLPSLIQCRLVSTLQQSNGCALEERHTCTVIELSPRSCNMSPCHILSGKIVTESDVRGKLVRRPRDIFTHVDTAGHFDVVPAGLLS